MAAERAARPPAAAPLTRAVRVLAVAGLALAAVLLLPLPASAADSDVIRKLSIRIDVRPDGTLAVTETYHWDFGARHGLGLTRVLDSRFDHEPDRSKVRVYEYGDFAAASPTGAPTGVWVRDEGARVRVDVGAPDGSDDRRTGLQVYRLTYSVSGALNAIRDDPEVADRDELYWNATGHDWAVPIDWATVTVRGPTGVVEHACYTGPHGSTTPCETRQVDGGGVAWSSTDLDPGSGMTVLAAFPPGTFGEIAPILTDRPAPFAAGSGPAATAAGFVWEHAAPLAALALAGLLAYGALRVLRGRDLRFAHLPPGVLAAPGSPARIERVGRPPVVAVRFTPPDGLRPGLVGALHDARVTTVHVTATIVDLAVRGHLRIREVSRDRRGRPTDWTLVDSSRTARRRDELSPDEHTLLTGIFGARRTVRLSQLRHDLHRTTEEARRGLAAELDARGLFRRPVPLGRRRRFTVSGVVGAVVLGYFVFHSARSAGLLAELFLAAVGALVAAAGYGVAAATRRAARQRTAEGRALYEQSRGFRRYLATAEAHQLRFEEGEDVFSRYLPYAIVYGVAERWARLFAELEAQGVEPARPDWYTGADSSGLGTPGFTDLGRSVCGFATTASTTLSATPGSSGGSGSSGGGGFSGGGGGGGGGGGR